MKPRVGSYGETATVTRSPSTTRMRWRRTLPASLARTSWPLSSLTRKLPPFAIKMTSPSRWTSSSLLMAAWEATWVALSGPQGKRSGAKVIGSGGALGLCGRGLGRCGASLQLGLFPLELLELGLRARAIGVVLRGLEVRDGLVDLLRELREVGLEARDLLLGLVGGLLGLDR